MGFIKSFIKIIEREREVKTIPDWIQNDGQT